MMESTSDQRWPILLLILLVVADFFFMAVEVLYSLGYAGDYRYSIGADRGYAEVYGYIKLFWIMLLFAWLAIKKYQPLYVVLALLFCYLLLDDSLKIHETMGAQFVDLASLNPSFGLRAKDFGELMVSALVGLFFLITGWVAYHKSNAFARRVGWYLLIGIAALAVFGVGADILHQMLGDQFPWTNTPLLILEDGGELVVISVICWFSYSLALRELAPPKIRIPFV